MKNSIQKLSVSLLSLFSTLAFPAVSLADCAGNSCKNVTVDRFYASDTALYIGTSDDEKKLNCTPLSEVYLTLPTSAANYGLISTVLLTAHESQNPIWVRISEGSNGCTINYVVSDK